MARKYSVYDRRTDMLIIINGTAAQCAACMGIDKQSFYKALVRQRKREDCPGAKYEIFIDDDQDDLLEED